MEGLSRLDDEDIPKREEDEVGEVNLFELSSNTRSMTVSGSAKVITLVSGSGLEGSADAALELLDPVEIGVLSSS